MIILLFHAMTWITRISEWMLLAAGRLGGPGVMIVALVDSSFFSLPEVNDVLIILLSAGSTWRRMIYYVVMTILGSTAGCIFLYSLGRNGGNLVLRRRFSQQAIERAENIFNRYGILAVLISSILPPPCPFKIFVLIAGVFRLKLMGFILAVAVGRTIRYSIWGVLAVIYGAAVVDYMQQNTRLSGIILLLLLLMTLGAIIWFHRGHPRMEKEDRA